MRMQHEQLGRRYELRQLLPPVEENVEYVEAGGLVLGIEGRTVSKDGGVCVHVFGRQAGKLLEFLRFDCFDQFPHYHYVYQREAAQDRILIDTAADGEALSWTLERLRTRLPAMLVKAGEPELAAQIDPPALSRALDRVEERLRAATAGATA